jgi:hypothetical protein
LGSISTNIQLPLKQRERSSTRETPQELAMSTSPGISRASSTTQATNELFAGPSSRKIHNFEQGSHFLHNDDEYDFYQLIHNSSLLKLMRNTSCQSCLQNWNGAMRLTKREGNKELF